MSWRSLGTVAPNLLDWQAITIPARGEVFRLNQDWVGEWPGTGWASLRLVYSNSLVGGQGALEYRKVFPFRDERIYQFPFDERLRQAGYTVRYFQLKLHHRARMYANANWEITISQFYALASRPEFQFDSLTTTIDTEELTMDITETFDLEV